MSGTICYLCLRPLKGFLVPSRSSVKYFTFSAQCVSRSISRALPNLEVALKSGNRSSDDRSRLARGTCNGGGPRCRAVGKEMSA